MKPFESFITPQLERYIKHRVSLGYNGRNLRSTLRPFDLYIKENAYYWNSFKLQFFLELRRKLNGESCTVNGVLSGVRNFFQFLVHLGHCPYNPLQDIPPLPVRIYFPFIFSPEKLEELLLSIKTRLSRTPENDLKHASIYIAILLMAICGLRISEPLGILLTHYRQNEGTIYIEKTKFQNDRLIPVPKSVLVEIEKYLTIRNSFIHEAKNPYLLVGQKQKSLSAHYIYSVFHQAVKDIGIDQARRKIANITFGSPTAHSLRHSFAVNTLNRIQEQEKSIWDALPILAVYLGHRKVRSTTRYLTVIDAQYRQRLMDFYMLHWDEL